MGELIGIDWIALARRDPYSATFAGSGVTALVTEIDRLTHERDQARAKLATAERWLRTINANPYVECPHARWAEEARGDIAAAGRITS